MCPRNAAGRGATVSGVDDMAGVHSSGWFLIYNIMDSCYSMFHAIVVFFPYRIDVFFFNSLFMFVPFSSDLGNLQVGRHHYDLFLFMM